MREKEADKIPVWAKQCLRAGSCITQLNLNQREIYLSRNQCLNQDKKLHCGREASRGWNWKQETEKGEGQKDFSTSCRNNLDLSRLMRSCDYTLKENDHSSLRCERKINQAHFQRLVFFNVVLCLEISKKSDLIYRINQEAADNTELISFGAK